MTTRIQTRIYLLEETLIYEITSHKTEPVRICAGEVLKGDTIPVLNSFGPRQVMKADFLRNKIRSNNR